MALLAAALLLSSPRLAGTDTADAPWPELSEECGQLLEEGSLEVLRPHPDPHSALPTLRVAAGCLLRAGGLVGRGTAGDGRQSRGIAALGGL